MSDDIILLKGAGGGKDSSSSGGTGQEAPNTLTDDSSYRAVYIISEGPIEGLSTTVGEQSIYLNDVPLQDSDGQYNFQGVSWATTTGLPDQSYISGFDGINTPIAVGQKVYAATPYEVTLASDDYDAVLVTIQIPALSHLNDQGNLDGTDLSYAIEVQAYGSSNWITAYTENFYNQKCTSAYQRSYRIDLPHGTAWSVRLRRITPDSTDVKLSNDLYFQRYDTIIDGKFSYPNTALLAIQVRSKTFGDSIPKVSVRAKGIKVWVPKNYDPVARTYATSGAGTTSGIWDGTFKAAWTNNPVWIYFDILTNNRYGLGQELNASDDLSQALLDTANLYVISQYCDALVDDGYGGTEPRYTLNAYINNSQNAYDLLQQVVTSFRGMLYFANNQIFTTADMPDDIDDVFTQADVQAGLFTYTGTALKTRSSVVNVSWKNPANVYKTQVEVVEDYDSIYKFGFREKNIDGFGVTSRGLARRLGRWQLLTEKMQTQTVTFATGWKGAVLFPGKVIKVSDPYKAGIRTGGKILSFSASGGSVTVNLDSPVTIDSGVTGSFTYALDDGTFQEVAVYGPLNTNTLTFSGPAPTLQATWMIATPLLEAQQFRVVQVVENAHGEYAVTALQHFDHKYDEIETGVIFDPEPTSILSLSSLVSPTDIQVSEWYEQISGSEVYPRITVSWTASVDKRADSYQVQLYTPTSGWQTVYMGSNQSWDSARLAVNLGTAYQVQVRAFCSILGISSQWLASDSFSIDGNTNLPNPPAGISCLGTINSFILQWIKPTYSDFHHVEIWTSFTNDHSTASLVATSTDTTYIFSNVAPGITQYFWLKTVTHSQINQISVFSSPSVSGTTRAVNSGDIATGGVGTGNIATSAITTVKIADANVTGTKIASNTIQGYHLTAALIDASKLASGAITGAALAAGAVGLSALDPAINPPVAVSSLPATSGYTGSKIVFLTTDGKLYRLVGGAWTSVTSSSDVSGTLAAANIPVLDAGTKIQAGSITGYQVAANTIAANNVVSGSLTSTQIQAGSITGDRLVAGTVSATYIAANAIGTTQLAANAVTAGKISVASLDAISANLGSISVDNAHIGNLAVDTFKIANNAVSTSGSVTVAGPIYGNGTTQYITGFSFYLPSTAASVYVIFSGKQNYSSTPASWGSVADIDGSSFPSTGGGATLDAMTYIYAVNSVGAGYHTVNAYWYGSGSNISLNNAVLYVVAIMK